jgi:DNA-binding CsgD family transcriptional regulator
MTGGTLSALRPLQRRIIVLIVDGATNQEIAERLNLDISSIHTHVRALMRQLGMTHRAQIAAWALQQELSLAGD